MKDSYRRWCGLRDLKFFRVAQEWGRYGRDSFRLKTRKDRFGKPADATSHKRAAKRSPGLRIAPRSGGWAKLFRHGQTSGFSVGLLSPKKAHHEVDAALS